MLNDLKKDVSLIRILVILLIFAVIVNLWTTLWYILVDFSDVLLVLIFSWLLSFILEPIVEFISKGTKLSKVWSAVLTYALFTLVISVAIYFYIPPIENQIFRLLHVLPAELQGTPSFITKWILSFTGSLDTILSGILFYLPYIANILFLFFITLLISFYLVVDKANIQKELYALTPRKWHRNLTFIQKSIDTTFASFLRLQLILGIISGITTFIVLTLFGVDFAVSSAFLAGLLTILPLIGPVIALIPPLLAALLLGWQKAILILLILVIIQQIVFNIIGPKLIGNAFKLHPIIVLLSFLVGLKIAGGIGAIFAVPVLGILVIIFREFGHYLLNRDSQK